MMSEIKSFERVGTMPHRSYYIPFAETEEPKDHYGIIDRTSSSAFVSLDGIWKIREHKHVDEFDIHEELDREISVPSCVQMHGFDQIQYINVRYPFPVIPPHVPYDNPSWHYRRSFELDKKNNERYYLNFEGVDSAFYLYINGVKKGYSQISHATSEFDVTDLLVNGENTVDVHVIKWCASSYLECQDKFRFSGIFRSVYLIRRPEGHIWDYKIETKLVTDDGIIRFVNESKTSIRCVLGDIEEVVGAGACTEIGVKNVKKWTPESPNLYKLRIYARGEMIEERIGFREVSIDGKVFKVNGQPVKLKGVNRHEFNCDTAATVSLLDMLKDIEIMKELNVNAVRTSHYQNCPEFYLLTDAYGIYVMDEADLETHGACAQDGSYGRELWSKFAECEMYTPGITDRHAALVERDKNRSSVIIWSLGNESSFGRSFFEGADYIRTRDNTRPIHYEGLQYADRKYYYSDKVDMVSMMYPAIEKIRKEVLDNPDEKRPFVLCEYTHAMGNSCGDISEYWDLIYQNDQMMGAFVWEWADHAIRTERGFLYGGDFGESEHDGNFCVDGLLTSDRKLKSGALEMQAVYAGKTHSVIRDVEIPKTKANTERIEISVDEHTGELTSIKADGREVLRSALRLNIMRYTDNDRNLLDQWIGRCKLPECRPYIISYEKKENTYFFEGVMAANCLMPAANFKLTYEVKANELEVSVSYELGEYVKSFPRFGLEACIDKKYDKFTYIGYGPSESYVDKHIASEYGMYKSSAQDNYCKEYIMPQESGSHYKTNYLSLDGLFTLTADNSFSFSMNPYTTEQLVKINHSHELPENDFVCLCVDLGMRGVGSHSCGPELEKKYEIPKKGANRFKFIF